MECALRVAGLVLQASDELDWLIASLARHSERGMEQSDLLPVDLACIRSGRPPPFGRLCQRLELAAASSSHWSESSSSGVDR